VAVRSIVNFCQFHGISQYYVNISLRAKVIVVLALAAIVMRQTGVYSAVKSLVDRVARSCHDKYSGKGVDSVIPKTAVLAPSPTATAQLESFLQDINTHVSSLQDLVAIKTKFGKLIELSNTSLDRLTSPRRANIEAEMIKNIQIQLPNKREKLRYLGTERGQGVLQDYINIGKLIQAGYENIEVVLLNVYAIGDSEQQQMDLLTQVADERKIQLTMTYTTTSPEIGDLFHIIQAREFMGFELVFPLFHYYHGLLAPQGHFYLICDDWNFCFTPEGCASQFFGESTAYPIEALAASLQETAEKKTLKELRFAFLSDDFHLHQWIDLFPRMCKKSGLEKVYLTLLPPQNSRVIVDRCSDIEQKSVNPAFKKPAVEKFLSLLCGKEVVLTYIPSPDRGDSSSAKFFSSDLDQAKFDIITFLFNRDTEGMLKVSCQALQKKHGNSSLFFDLTGENFEAAEEENSDDNEVDFDDLLGQRSPPGSREENTAWQGTWKWEQKTGVTFIGDRANAQDQEKIKAFMTSS
jgi:hypothetical protein